MPVTPVGIKVPSIDAVLAEADLDKYRHIREQLTEHSSGAAHVLSQADQMMAGDRSPDFYLGLLAGVSTAAGALLEGDLLFLLPSQAQFLSCVLGVAVGRYDRARRREHEGQDSQEGE